MKVFQYSEITRFLIAALVGLFIAVFSLLRPSPSVAWLSKVATERHWIGLERQKMVTVPLMVL
mgnify:CR=1 FL=1